MRRKWRDKLASAAGIETLCPGPQCGRTGYLRHRWDLGLRMSSFHAVLAFSLARLGIKRGRKVLALEVYSGSRRGMHWKQVRGFSARFAALSSSLPVARFSALWLWLSVWRGPPRLS